MKKLLVLISFLLFTGILFAQAPGDPPLIGQAAQTATINNIIPITASATATYVAGFNSFSIQIVSTGTAGTFIFEESLDNVTFQPATVFNSALQIPVSINTAITPTSSSIIYKGAISGYWLRCRIATTITGGSIQSVTKLITTQLPFTQQVVAQGTAGNLLGTMSQGGTWTIQPGNTPNTSPWLFGGNIADGIAPTGSPNPTAGMTIGGLTKRVLTNEVGGLTGPGEIGGLVNIFTAGSTTAAEGTNAKTFQSFTNKNCDVYLGILSQGNAANTIQLEGSYDNQIFSVIPLTRIDNLAAYSAGVSGAYSFLAAWTPVTGASYKGKTYGYNYIRVHQTALTTTGITAMLRIVPIGDDAADNSITSAFTFDAQNTTEAVGTLNGVLQSGGVRTLTTRGAIRGQLILDAFTYATAAPTASTLIVEGTVDGVTWTAIPLQLRSGGPTVTSIVTTPPAIGQWLGGQYDFDCTNYLQVRARWSAFTIGTATLSKYHGAIKLISNSNKDVQRKRTYRTAFIVTTAATPTDVFQIIGSATTTVEISKIIISGTLTAAAMADVYISKRSTANSAGTSTASTMVPLVSSDAAATAAGAIYTANPTTGTPVGNVWIESVPFATTAGLTNNIVSIDFAERGKPIQLLGVAQALAINLNGATTTGLALKVTVEFVEY